MFDHTFWLLMSPYFIMLSLAIFWNHFFGIISKIVVKIPYVSIFSFKVLDNIGGTVRKINQARVALFITSLFGILFYFLFLINFPPFSLAGYSFIIVFELFVIAGLVNVVFSLAQFVRRVRDH